MPSLPPLPRWIDFSAAQLLVPDAAGVLLDVLAPPPDVLLAVEPPPVLGEVLLEDALLEEPLSPEDAPLELEEPLEELLEEA